LIELILSGCGPKFRADSPSDFKDFILQLQNTQATLLKKSKEEETGISMVRFDVLLEMIYDLKNNKFTQKETFQHLVNTKRSVFKLLPSSSHVQLGITWEDLQLIETKGRWWLVGSSHSASRNLQTMDSEDSKQESRDSSMTELLVLAQKHRMNTEIRKAVFCVMMGSTDYLDAFERLLKLNLKSKQDRDIVYVLMYCCEQVLCKKSTNIIRKKSTIRSMDY
jgi:nucleolar MIF4G domain-containing protein 1